MRPVMILGLAWATAFLTAMPVTFGQDTDGDRTVLNESFVLTDDDSKHCEFEEAHAALRAKLSRRIKIDFDKTPLVDAVASIAKQIDAPIVVEHVALDDSGANAATDRTSKKLGRVIAASGLDRILDEHGLSWRLGQEVIVITSMDLVYERHETRVFPVADILAWMKARGEVSKDPNGLLQERDDSKGQFQWGPDTSPRDAASLRLSEIVKAATRSTDGWDDAEGANGQLTVLNQKLIVRADRFTLETIEVFLQQLKSLIQRCETRKAFVCATCGYGDPKNRDLLARLKQRGSVRFERLPLETAIERIADSSGVTIDVNWTAALDVGIPRDEPVTLSRIGSSYRAIVDSLLDPLFLVAVPRDGGLFITHSDLANEEIVPMIYDTRDLIRPNERSWLVELLREKSDNDSDNICRVESIGGLLLVAQPSQTHDELLAVVARLR